MNEAAIAWLAKKSFSVHREACNLTKFPGGKSAQGHFQQEASLTDNSTKTPLNLDELNEITQELHGGQLSRRGLSDRLKALGLGFGAAFVLGITGAQASTNPDTTVALKSTNPAINSIIQDGTATGQTATDAKNFQQVAWFRRFFRRFFNRFYRRW